MTNINNECNLSEIETQNMNTSLELFEILKQNAEEYCSYIKKYKECTAAYYDKLSKLTFNVKKDNTINKNLNISKIFAILNKVPELVKLQQDGIKKIVESLDLTLKPLENVLKNEINSLEEPKKFFEENKKKYSKSMVKNKKLMDSLSLTEKKIIKYYVAKKKQKDFSEEKTNMINSLKETKILEFDYIETNNGTNNYHWVFQEETLKSVEDIKSHIRIILENLNSSVLFFLLVFNNCYSPCVNFVQEEKKKNESKPIDTKQLINDNMIIHTYTLDELPSDKYKIKILNNPESERLPYSVDITNYDDPSKNGLLNFPLLMTFTNNIINFFNKDNDISDDIIFSNLNKIDLLGLAKKFYHNFKMVSKTKYDIQSEEEKIKVKNYTDILILMKKYKNSKKANEKLTHEEKKKLLELVKKKENREIFLSRLNKIRSFGNFEYPKKVFNEILSVFQIILDEIEVDQDPFSFQFSVILSQTFYFLENGQKQYFCKFLNSHKVFHNPEMWEKLTDYMIKEKTDKYNDIEYKVQNKKYSDDEIKKKDKINQIIFAQLISVSNNMCDYNFDIDMAEKIMMEYIKRYELEETYTQMIMDIINNKRKEINNKSEIIETKNKEDKKK
jgi:hypothetical protein